MNEAKQHFLAEQKLAIVGISATKGFGNTVYRDLQKKGYILYPVSKTANEIDGTACYKKLEEIPDTIGGVITVVPPAVTLDITKECVKLGIKRIWMQPGSDSGEAMQVAFENHIETIVNSCIMMYAKPDGMHKVHGWFTKLVGKY